MNFRRAQKEMIGEKAFEIQCIYILRDFHGKRIGQMFINEVLNIAKLNAISFVCLDVWKENRRALDFQRKNVFLVFAKYILKHYYPFRQRG